MKIAHLAGIALLAFAAEAAADQWVQCATEDRFCKFDGKREVAYGHGDKWVVKWANNGVKCSNSVFGDPAFGKPKVCRVKVSHNQPVEDTVDRSWVKCANEGADCRVQGTKRVAFGANGKFRYRNIRGAIQCSTNNFGGDPVPYVAKACYFRP